MSAKEPQPMPEMFKRSGDKNHIPVARPAAPTAPPSRASAKAAVSKFMIKSDHWRNVCGILYKFCSNLYQSPL